MSNKGVISGRETFIRNIASRLGRDTPLTAPPDRPVVGVPDHYKGTRLDESDRMRLFVEELEKLTGHAIIVREDEAVERIGEYLLSIAGHHGVRSVARWDDERLAALGVDERLAHAGIRSIPWNSSTPSERFTDELPHVPGDRASGEMPPGSNWSQRSSLLQAVERCELGIVWADAAIANTGTLVLCTRAWAGRSVSLLPGILFAVFRVDQIVTRMGEAFDTLREQYGEEMPSSIHLVTGPSRSADIENDLTIGVHGPGKVYAVIIAP